MSYSSFDQSGPLDLYKDTMIGGPAQKESFMGWITILLKPSPITDPFPAWKPTLCHKDTAKGKESPY